MPNLQKFSFDIRTDDERFVDQEQLKTTLPLSINKLDFFIRYYYSKSKTFDTTSSHFLSPHFPIVSMLDKPRRRFLIHTIPYNQRSAILTGTISKQMPDGWFYTQKIQNLYIYDITSTIDLLLVLQHFHQLRILSIDMKDKSEILTLLPQSKSIQLNFPYLKQIEISGIIDLSSILINAPNLDYMIVYFECLKIFLNNETNCQLITKRIVRLNILDWIDVNTDLLLRVHESFNYLRHLVIMMKDSKVLIDDFVLKILSLWKDKTQISIDVKGILPEEIGNDIRQWIIRHTHIKQDYLFAAEYSDNWFDLWL